MRVETLKESASNAEGARAGDGLGDGNVVEDGGVGAIGELCGRSGVGRYTGDTSVLLVGFAGDDALLGLAHGGEHVRLASIVAVSSNTCSISFSAGFHVALNVG